MAHSKNWPAQPVMSCAGLFFLCTFLDVEPKIYIFVCWKLKILLNMRRLFLILAALLIAGVSYAQSPDRALMEAQIVYDEAVLAYKRAVTDTRNEERRVIEATEHLLEESHQDLVAVKRNYKAVVAEQKQRVAEAKRQLKEATMRYKEESMRAKQEVEAVKANTKSVIAERKSDVARAKAEIARIKADAVK